MAKDTDYTYAVARIRMNEAKLLSDSELIALISVQSASEILQQLKDRGWGDEIADETAETITSSEEQKLWKLIRSASPDFSVFSFFAVRNDYHNLKCILKGIYTDKDYHGLLAAPVTVPVKVLEKAVTERSFLPLHSMERAAEEAYDVLTRTGDGQSADLILDRAAMTASLAAAEATGNDFISGFARHQTALTDIKIAYRAVRTGRNADFLASNLIAVPTLNIRALASAADDGTEAIASYLSRTDYAACGEAMKLSAQQLEKVCDDWLNGYCKSAKCGAFGAAPLFAYVNSKQTELRSVRIILSAKAAGVSEEDIRRRVRDSYV